MKRRSVARDGNRRRCESQGRKSERRSRLFAKMITARFCRMGNERERRQKRSADGGSDDGEDIGEGRRKRPVAKPVNKERRVSNSVRNLCLPSASRLRFSRPFAPHLEVGSGPPRFISSRLLPPSCPGSPSYPVFAVAPVPLSTASHGARRPNAAERTSAKLISNDLHMSPSPDARVLAIIVITIRSTSDSLRAVLPVLRGFARNRRRF